MKFHVSTFSGLLVALRHQTKPNQTKPNQDKQTSGPAVQLTGPSVPIGTGRFFPSETHRPLGDVDPHCCLVSRLKTTGAVHPCDFMKIAVWTVILKIVRRVPKESALSVTWGT